MRRRVTGVAGRMGVLLLVGAVVNVGVAWCCTALTMGDVLPGARRSEGGEVVGENWPVRVPDWWPVPHGRGRNFYNAGFTLDSWEYNWHWARPHEQPDPEEPEANLYLLARGQSGLPWKSMEWRELQEIWTGRHRAKTQETIYGRTELPAWCRRGVSLVKGEEVTLWRVPLLPLWGGFIGNTLVYAALACAPLGAWRLGRTRLRRRRGACVACGYDIRGLQTCPECGR